MSVTLASIVGSAAVRSDEHPLLVPTLRALQARLEARARRLAPLDYDLREELLAAGARAVADVVKSFDATLGVPLAAVATQRAYHRMQNTLRQHHSLRYRRTMRFADDSGDTSGDEIAPHALVTDEPTPLELTLLEEQRATVSRAIGRLAVREAAVVAALLAGDSQADIARSHQVSRMAVSKWVASIRRALKAHLRSEVYDFAA